jgi:hypothetical protein
MRRFTLKAITLSAAIFMLCVSGVGYGATQIDALLLKKSDVRVVDRIQRNEIINVIVEIDASDVEAESINKRKIKGISHDDSSITAYRKQRYQEKKDILLNALLPDTPLLLTRDFSHLPMFAVKIHHINELNALARRSDVLAIYEDIQLHMHLAQSAPLIQQPRALTLNKTGAGTTVAVLDSGVDYTRSAFGSCTSPGVPSGCKVIYAQDIAPDDGSRDDNGHGSNVAGIVVGIAPGTKIAALDVFNGTSASSSDIISAINWSIANQSAYNIVAMNMSLGSGVYASCSTGSNPFKTPIANAKSAGIHSVASSGNDGSSTGISIPACTPQAISVGAVYDSNIGAMSYSMCSDATTAADKIACFSNSASILSVLAPGAWITAAGATYAGTSQASPHVSGALAVLRSAYPLESLDTISARLTTRGVSVTDSRNGLVKPRIDMLAALGAVNNAFSAAVSVAGVNGTVYANNIDATKESGEPNHGGVVGGKSVWWKWIAPYTSKVTISTEGSSFTTVQAVYTGSAVNLLNLIAPVSSTSRTYTFNAVADTTYNFVVDGVNAASGVIQFAWKYDDTDGDGIIDGLDNCVSVSNANQANFDGDSQGDACDADDDNDGLLDTEESIATTDPFDKDSDNDGVWDGDEVHVYGTSPKLADTDDDGLSDGDEILAYHMNPLSNDKGRLAPRGNPDNELNVADLLVLERLTLGFVSPTAVERALADMNKDGQLDIVDMLLLERTMLGL